MEPIDIGLAVTAGLLVFVVLGMRVAFAAGLAGLVGLIWIFWSKKGYAPEEFGWALTVAAKTAGQVPHSKVSSQALSLIPTFILIGYLAYYAGLTRALFEAAKRWIAWVPGGLAVSTVFATAGFAAVSGASVATSAVFARIAIPEMLAIGYNKKFAAGVVAAGGTLASADPALDDPRDLRDHRRAGCRDASAGRVHPGCILGAGLCGTDHRHGADDQGVSARRSVASHGAKGWWHCRPRCRSCWSW